MKVAMPGYLRFPYKSWIPLVGMVLSNNRLTVGNSCRDSFLKIPGFSFLFVPHSWFDRSCTFGCRNRTARLNENKQVWLVRRSSLIFVSTCRPLTLSTNALAQGFFSSWIRANPDYIPETLHYHTTQHTDKVFISLMLFIRNDCCLY